MTRHFLRDDDLSPREQRDVLELALAFRDDRFIRTPLTGPRAVAVIFDKPTLRTQVSFAAGIAELGGFPLSVDGKLARIGERESIADTALSSFVMFRTKPATSYRSVRYPTRRPPSSS